MDKSAYKNFKLQSHSNAHMLHSTTDKAGDIKTK